MSEVDLYSYDARIPPEMLAELRLGALWGMWSLDAAGEGLQWPVDELASEMQKRSDYGWKMQNIFKMLLIERLGAMYRSEVVDALVERVRAALVRGGFDASDELMYASIDFEVVPSFTGVDSDEVSPMRPKVWRE